jgi:hypothetical protein
MLEIRRQKMVRSFLVAATLLAGAACPVSADILHFIAPMDGLQEVPPFTTPGSGFANLTLNTLTGGVTLNGSYQNLLGNVAAVHIHGMAPVGQTASLSLLLNIPFVGTTTGTLNAAGTLTAAQVQGMIEGLTYINVHTTAHPSGEIRGQIVVPAPGAATVLAIGGLVALRRRRA